MRDRAVRRFGRTRMVWGFGRLVRLLTAIIGITTGGDAGDRQHNFGRVGRSGSGRRFGDSHRLLGLEFSGGFGGNGRHLGNGFGDGVDHGTGAGGPGLQSGLDNANGGNARVAGFGLLDQRGRAGRQFRRRYLAEDHTVRIDSLSVSGDSAQSAETNKS